MRKLIGMHSPSLAHLRRTLVACAAVAALATTAGGYAVAGTGGSPRAADQAASGTDLERCNLNAPRCQHIGMTDAWFNGSTLNLNYSHRYFCGNHRLSQASTGCEIGAPTKVRPTGGVVVSPIYVISPVGFRPKNLQCPVAGNCIDHPRRVDASRVFGPAAKNALAPPHSHIIIDRENGLSSWWPVIVIGVTSPKAWAEIAQGKSLATVQKIRRAHPKQVTPNIPSNIYLFFQAVPGPDNDAHPSG